MKSKVRHLKFCAMVQTKFNIKVTTVRSDNSSEFTSNTTKKFYKGQGIIHKTSCIDTPQQNEKEKRKYHHALKGS